MKHNKTLAISWLTLALLSTVAKGGAQLPLNLGSAGDFAILAETKITMVPTGNITGDIGISPNAAASITGFPMTMDSSGTFSTSPQVIGKIYAVDYAVPTPAKMNTAILDMVTAYNLAAGRTLPNATELWTGNISGQTITNGLYKWTTGVLINTDVTLDAGGNPDAVFVFQISGDLTMASGAKVMLAGGAQAKNIFWQIAGGAGAKIEAAAHIEGVVLTSTAIIMEAGASFNGKLLAQTAVTLISNTIVDSNLIPKLEIVSEHGVGNPTNGVYFHVSGTVLTNSVSDTETLLGGTQYVNTGWSMIGNSPLSGMTNSMTMTHTNDAVLTWQWSTNYFLTLSATNGSISSATNGWYLAGSTNNLTAIADLGYTFNHWEINGITNGSVSPLPLIMDTAKNVVAVFIPAGGGLSLEIISEHGIGNPTTGLYSHVSGTLLTNSVSATETLLGGTQYVNRGWSMTNNSPFAGLTNSMNMTLTNNAVLTWQWNTNYFLTLSATNGSIPIATNGWYLAGSTNNLTAIADLGYTFNHWEINGITNGSVSPLPLIMDTAKNVVAVFIPAGGGLSLEIISEHGIGNPTTGLYFHVSGTLLTNSVSATETLLGGTQYVNRGWSMTNNSPFAGLTNSMNMTLTNNAVLTWQWNTNYYLSLTATNGSILNTAADWKPANSNYSLSVLAAPGYAFDHWEMNGLTNGAGDPFVVSMTQAQTIVAVFRSLFVDISSNVDWNVSWVFNPRKGFFIGTLTITNSSAVKILSAPFWFQVANTTNYWLRYPSGTNGNTGLPYLDITPSVTNQLQWIGNSNLVLDVGESVTVTGIELMGRRTPDGLLMAVWADPPGMLAKPVDTDGDGIPDVDEYIAGTSAVDPNSAFRIRLGPDGHSVQWDGKPNRVYTVLTSTNLSQGFAIEEGNIQSTGNPMTHQPVQRLSDPGTGETRFYRVNVNLK